MNLANAEKESVTKEPANKEPVAEESAQLSSPKTGRLRSSTRRKSKPLVVPTPVQTTSHEMVCGFLFLVLIFYFHYVSLREFGSLV